MSALMNPASYSPLLLQAQITAPTTGGELGLADTTLLENPFQGPMWLDSIQFSLTSQSGVQRNGWSSIFVRLILGNTPITQGHVPIASLGKVLNDSAVGEGYGVYTSSPDMFVWHLPKPLFIPARELLRPTIYVQPYANPKANVINITYACRPLPVGTPAPKKLQVPWVAAFVPPFLQTGGSDRTDQSQPSDLYNPWDQDLHVQRFVGHLMPLMDTSASIGEDSPNMDLASAKVDGQGNVTVGTLVTAQDSFNNILIRDPTPFSLVFSQLDRAWTVNALLPSKGFYVFTVDRLWSTYAAESAKTATVGISMVGWREVDYV